ncbi:LexA family transcriptional regulator [Massilia sp. YIM B02763]|uniref:LexA family transcriptional regulator n=1 Tax=Massilia sp. YIM B02763 TaxID=3050130 RepID=UPI0025B6BC11|nr:LexA family transcriptional regulator [Massilia sp. YIM B02763]MDN4056361.1 LexA family transcriptional regulator [Massilia sp. YIM B02763]
MENNKHQVHDIVERMKQVLGFEADVQLSTYFGGGRSTAGGWKARGVVPFKECLLLAVRHNVSLDWLVLGRGSQDAAEHAVAEAGAEEGGGVDVDSTSPQAVEVPGDAGIQMQPVDIPGYVDLPVLDMGQFDLDNRGFAWKVPCSWLDQEGLTVDDTVMVRAVGDPMEPTIVDGEMVVVDRRPRDTDGVFLVRFGDTVRFKRVQRMVDGSIRLSNDNPAYMVDVVKKGEEDSIEIIGYCHASVRSVR